MSTFLWTVVSFFVRLILSLRYRIVVRGRETLNPERLRRGGGILFLPNHPALMDPFFIALLLWPKYRMRPIVIEYIYRKTFVNCLMRLVKALPIPNFETSVNQIKIHKAEKVTDQVVEGLRNKENFLVYPAGRMKSRPREVLGGASAAHTLVERAPETNVVLIRTTGLWGSRFSRALTGRSPDMMQNIFIGIGLALKNLIFFMPRRRVIIELEAEPPEVIRGAQRLDFNRSLESWYNRYPDEKDENQRREEEPLKLVSYAFWKKDLPSVYRPKKKKNGEAPVSPEIRDKVCGEIARLLDNPNAEIRPEMHLAVDLGLDSLQIAELITTIGHHFDIGELHPEDIDTVQSVLELAEGSRASEPARHQLLQMTWPSQKDRPPPLLPMGRTIPEAFLNSCERLKNFSACGDDLIGVLSYKQLKRAVLVLAEEFRKSPEERIGVLLPASIAAYIVILAIQCANKTPVMINWTLGSRYIDDMVKQANVTRVLSSWRFLERLSHVDFGSISDKVEMMEDIRSSLKLGTKLRGAFLSLFGTQAILRSLGLHAVDENAHAVILFTSGTEASPKGVPLSHKNIIWNQRAAMQCIDFNSNDVMYGILPPFHSFGFSVVGLFLLLAGMRVAYYPDPTDSFALAEGIARWKITYFVGTPNFLKGVLKVAKKEQLATVRYFVTGAEKAPQELFDKVKQLGGKAKLIEGYGITECAPILSLTPVNLPPKGVGRLLPGIEFCLIHPETEEVLPLSTNGELCVRGPNVFSGYLGNPRSPFIEIEGKKWYRTGDYGHFDEEGNLILSGRLKRFAKIAGEMISLGAVEEAIIAELRKQGRITEDTPSAAVVSDERDPNKAEFVLFTTFDIDKDAINQIIAQSGFSRIIKIAKVQKIEEIPLLGTGKTDYRTLQSKIT